MNSARHASGFSMIEVLVTLVILLVGLLGLAGLMAQSQRSEMESYQRVQAVTLLQDMANRINANRMAATCYNFTNAAGSPWLGTASTYAPACTPLQIVNYYMLSQNSPYSALSAPTATDAVSPAATAIYDMTQWNQLLLGAAEATAAGGAGAMVNARGCVSYDQATELPELDTQTGLPTGKKLLGTGVYTISVAWQGSGETAAVAGLTCGTGQYYNNATPPQVDEKLRRVVSLTLRMAALTK